MLATLSEPNLSLYDFLAEAKTVPGASTEGESHYQSFLGGLVTDDRDQLQGYFSSQGQILPNPLNADCQACIGDSGREVQAKQILRDEVQAVGWW